jgi:hypothetical protein
VDRTGKGRPALTAAVMGAAALLAACEATFVVVGTLPGDGDVDVDGLDDGPEAGEGEGAEEEAEDMAPGEEEEGPVEPWISILFPEEGALEPNPVTFLFEAGGGVVQVTFVIDGWELPDMPVPADPGSYTYRFNGVNFERHVLVVGLDGSGVELASDEVTFTPTAVGCSIPDQEGFNHYTVAAINDSGYYPKDGTYPYCWSGYGDECNAPWGQIYDGMYAGELLFPGGGDCFCSGHTLEIFLRAYRIWQMENGVLEDTLFTVEGSTLTVDDVDIGDFYQRWQGFGVASTASSADAFEMAGIGQNIYEEEWDAVLPGDYVNLSRTTGSGHAVIFVDWIVEDGVKVGLRYYGCNTSGDSCPDPDDPENMGGMSGPGFKTERFSDYGGTVMPVYLFIGRVFMPTP